MTILNDLSGSEYAYDYRALGTLCSADDVARYCTATRPMFAKIARGFDHAGHTEWLTRSFLALKLILGATVLISSSRHAEAQNLRIAQPYLNYYALLNCARAFVLTLPDHAWKGATSLEMTHQNAINSAANALRRLDPRAETRWGDVLRVARDHRELFSYRFPGSGTALLAERLVTVDAAEELSRLLAELAQMNTECLEAAVRKHAPGPWELLDNEDVTLAMTYEMRTELQIDDDDTLRIGRYFGRLKRPLPLSLLATAGLVEDFFGAWTAEDMDGVYDPDKHWRLLLHVD